MIDGLLTMIDRARIIRRAAGAILLLGFAVAAAPAANAQSCQEDFAKFSQRRNAAIAGLNSLTKANKGKMDPVAACPAFRRLVAIEGEMLGYMTKNKEWCAIPDEAVAQFKSARGKSQTFATKACNFAAQMKKMQAMQKAQAAQQAAGGGMQAPKLPSGPL